MQQKFKFKKAVIKDEPQQLEDEGEDMGDDMDAGGDIADMANQDISEDDLDEGADPGAQGDDFRENQII